MIPHGSTIFSELSFTETEPVTSRCQPLISNIVVLSHTILKNTFNAMKNLHAKYCLCDQHRYLANYGTNNTLMPLNAPQS